MSKRPMYLMAVIAILFLGGVTWAVHDVTKPGDVIQGVPNDGVSQNDNHGWPGNEAPNQAIDDQITTKFLHFKGDIQSTGVRITPKAGPTVVTGLRFCTANDAEPRDPASYELSGSNESIDGPYTLIAKGPLVDFTQGAVWPRRTWNATPITFANTVAYKHYQLMFPTIRDAPNANSMQIAEIELLAPDLTPTAPNPANNAIGVTMPLFQWTPGDLAAFEDVYIGTKPDLTEADRSSNHQPAMLKMHYYMKGLTPGQTYYWRVDDIDATGKVYTGTVWKFMASPLTAYNPVPRDGDKWLSVTTSLGWQPGQNGIKHDVYFGTDKAKVEARDASVAKGTMSTLTFNPGSLTQNTTYYWAVDETTISGQKQVGTVWSFTTVGTGGGVRGDYFVGTTPSGVPVLSRIDPTINFNLTGSTSPGSPVPGDGWSARWTADLEIAVGDTYSFSINCQDGTRMWIDGELIIDKWVTPTVTSEYFSLPMYLERGIHSLRVEFFDSGGDAVEQLYWWSVSSPTKVILPAGPLQPPLRASASYPTDKAVNIPQNATLVWGTGEKALKHNVYFGEDAKAVAEATPANTAIYRGQQAKDKMTFAPGTLEWNKTYYWRIDEVNDSVTDSPWKGSVWSFTTADFLVVDDMESYTDKAGSEIFSTWADGFVDKSSGSTVGYETAVQGTFGERTIIHGGAQSMPMAYDNSKSPFYSEAVQAFAPLQDWTIKGVTDLSLWVRGYPAPVSVAVTEAAGKISLTGAGTDIWNNSDQFTFAYKTLTGDGSIVARVVSNGTGTNTWAKGGVMIRDNLDGGSTFANTVITGGGGNGASFQYRLLANGGCGNTDSTSPIAVPYWVKIERVGDNLNGYLSTDGKTWRPQGVPQTIAMTAPVYIGLCVTSHAAGQDRTFQFDSIATTGGVSGQWQGAVIASPRYNSTQPMYVVVEDSAGKSATATDATIANAAAWTQWKVPLSSLTGVNLAKVKKLTIGVGDKKNPAADGSGLVFIDDICVTKP